MTPYALRTLTLCVVAAGSEVIIALAAKGDKSPNRLTVPQLAFVAGPLLFLALLAWRRRRNPACSRLLFWVALMTAICGLLLPGFNYLLARIDRPNRSASGAYPLIVPLIQWVVVMGTWVALAIQEGRGKQAENKTT
jgi:hypothetical protein